MTAPPVSPARLLDAWEAAAAAAPVVRPLHLLRALEPGRTVDELGDEVLGRRDARLARLRQALAGPAVEATTACPSCGETVETVFDVHDVWPEQDAVGVADEVEVAADGYSVTCRPATTADLVEAAAAVDPEAVLLARCVMGARRHGEPVDPAGLPSSVRLAVDAALAEADPGADVELSLTCPACETGWACPFDLATFLWEEVDHAARRTLAEVDVLARAYGWREPDILALSPWRRRRYLELVQQ